MPLPMTNREGTIEEYVVSNTKRIGDRIGKLILEYDATRVLDELDSTTALVEMPRHIASKIAREHPELTIELNLPYKHL